MKILIIRTDRIGDVVLSIPVISALRKAYPQAHIAFLTRPYTKELLEGNPELNEILEYDSEENLYSTIRTLREKKFDIAILLHPTFRLVLLLFLSWIPIRIGTGYRFYSFLFNRRVYIHRKRDEFHEAEFNLQLLNPLVQRIERINQIELTDYLPRVYSTPSNREWVEERLDKARNTKHEARSTKKVVIVHPGSGGNAPQWRIERFASVAEKIQKNLERTVVVTGGEEEKRLCQEMVERMRADIPPWRDPYNLAGETTIGQLTALLEKADLLVTNSTGPMHIAAAVGTPVVSIFCPRRGCHPRRWRPLGEGHRILMADVQNCKRCSRDGREEDCMGLVKEEEVYDACQKILNSE
ncbi:glycosyltransferase family 9 protein [candidate division TA06 bacterium]|nr:glycosyltransferase family 9 protein [candidate division TA06 bacterium]